MYIIFLKAKMYIFKKKKKKIKNRLKAMMKCGADASFSLKEELSLINVDGWRDFSSELCVPGHVWAGIFSLS